MSILADLPSITQQHKQYENTANEPFFDIDSFPKFTLGNKEYADLYLRYSNLLKTNLIESQVIQKRVNDLTFFGSLDIENPENTLSPSEVNSVSMLINSYKREVNRLKNKNQPISEVSEHIFSYVIKRLYKLPFDSCAVEINSDDSIKFTLSFSNERLLMITKGNYIEDLGIAKNQVIYSFFINRKLIASDVTNLDIFTKNFKGYISL